MKKFLAIFLTVVILGVFLKYSYTSNKCKDINYAVTHYFTSGIFNSYKMNSVDTLNLTFSNSNIAVMKVDGMEKESPHRQVSYNVFLEKNSQGIWKVKKVYPSRISLDNP